jgi:hypothetical protein
VSANAKKEGAQLEEYSKVDKGNEEAGGSAGGEGHGHGHGGGDNQVAFSIWLGILIDGIPESMLIGFMQVCQSAV